MGTYILIFWGLWRNSIFTLIPLIKTILQMLTISYACLFLGMLLLLLFFFFCLFKLRARSGLISKNHHFEARKDLQELIQLFSMIGWVSFLMNFTRENLLSILIRQCFEQKLFWMQFSWRKLLYKVTSICIKVVFWKWSSYLFPFVWFSWWDPSQLEDRAYF